MDLIEAIRERDEIDKEYDKWDDGYDPVDFMANHFEERYKQSRSNVRTAIKEIMLDVLNDPEILGIIDKLINNR